ncbi:MAG TPA: Mov34/MPN/PAD-1 family protein [Roseiflexaceae bacterium]|nr:Mov34/MPN/PAD-1 family protein [Roseiflexaceae bacterium]
MGDADLAVIFADLHRHHVATPREPLPPPARGATWIWAGNGIWKRGSSAALEALICVCPVTTPGLAELEPSVRWTTHDGRIPGALLAGLLDHARRAGAREGAVDRPIEQQYFITYQAGAARPFQVEVPPQRASATAVDYELGHLSGVPLVDLHSHHSLLAYFSPTDDRDDDGLSVSAVVGEIFKRPAIAVRINVYGHHQRVPAALVFDELPDGLRDTFTSNTRRHSHASAVTP